MQDPIFAKIEGVKRPTLTAASGFVLLAALGLWVSELVLHLLPQSAWSWVAVENAVYYLPFLALPVALYMRGHPGLSEAMRLKPLPPGPMLGVALLALLSVFACSALAALWGWGLDALGLRGANASLVPQTQSELLLGIVVMAAVPAVCEELLFRGFALAAWESRGTWFAIGVTALLFALLHGNLYGLPVYLLVGAVSGFVTFALDSLYAGITYHTIYNAACLVIPYLQTDAAGEAEIAASASLALSLAANAAMLLSMMAVLLAALRQRARRLGIEPIPRVRRPLSTGERLMLTAAVLVMLATAAIVLVLAAQGGTP